VPRKWLDSAKHQRRLLKCSVLARLPSVAVPRRPLGMWVTGCRAVRPNAATTPGERVYFETAQSPWKRSARLPINRSTRNQAHSWRRCVTRERLAAGQSRTGGGPQACRLLIAMRSERTQHRD